MAKKSAKSKGYRKQAAKKKPYLTKKEIIILCAVLAVAAIVAIVLGSYNDGALKVRDGVVQTGGDNWLIVNGSQSGRARYFKMGEVGDIEGFTLDEVSSLTDPNVPTYGYVPVDAENPVTGITITTARYPADKIAETSSGMMGASEDYSVSEIRHAEVNGTPVTYYIYTSQYYYEDEDAAAGESEDVETGEGEAAEPEEGEAAQSADGAPAPNHFSKALTGYIDGAHESSVLFMVQCAADSPEDYPADEVLLSTMEQIVPVLKLETK